MAEAGLLFQPDDPAKEIYKITSGELVFSPDEYRKAGKIVKKAY
ncbi:MAG: hypothetical protein Q9M31_00705 [Mariprofundus sp.]|nr:hypothetical protein [Mariprofundus sp.]